MPATSLRATLPARPTPAPATPAAPRPRADLSVQSLRGLAVILMVAGHVIGDDGGRGLQVADDSLWRSAYLLLDDIRMPFFTLLSGYVYALRPVRGADAVPGFLRRKVDRLLVPLLFVGLTTMAVQAAVPGTNEKPGAESFLQLVVFGYQHLWFLLAAMVIFSLTALLDAHAPQWTARSHACLVTGAFALALFVQVPAQGNVFAINQATWLWPFFLVGAGLQRFGLRTTAPRVGALAAVTTLLLVTGALGLAEGLPSAVVRLHGLATGLCALLLVYLVRGRLHASTLARLGAYSYGIYLWHVLGAAGSRIVLTKLGLTSTALLFVLGIAVAIAVPVVAERTVGRTRWGGWLAFGRRPRPATS